MKQSVFGGFWEHLRRLSPCPRTSQGDVTGRCHGAVVLTSCLLSLIVLLLANWQVCVSCLGDGALSSISLSGLDWGRCWMPHTTDVWWDNDASDASLRLRWFDETSPPVSVHLLPVSVHHPPVSTRTCPRPTSTSVGGDRFTYKLTDL